MSRRMLIVIWMYSTIVAIKSPVSRLTLSCSMAPHFVDTFRESGDDHFAPNSLVVEGHHKEYSELGVVMTVNRDDRPTSYWLRTGICGGLRLHPRCLHRSMQQ